MSSIVDFENSIKGICKSYSDKIYNLNSKMMKELQNQINNTIYKYSDIAEDNYDSIDMSFNINEDYRLRLCHSAFVGDFNLYTIIYEKRIIDNKEVFIQIETDICAKPNLVLKMRNFIYNLNI